MSSAIYTVVTELLDSPKTHPNLPENEIGWEGPIVIVHDEDYALWTEGEPASPGLARFFKHSEVDLLLEEIKESPYEAELAIRSTGGLGSHTSQKGYYCNGDLGRTVKVTPKRSRVTFFMQMSRAGNWFTGTTMNPYTNLDYVWEEHETTYPMALGISRQNSFGFMNATQFLDTPGPVTSYLTSSDNTTLWGNGTFASSCSSEMFPVARFHLTRIDKMSSPDYPDLRIACGVLSGISFLSIMLSIILLRKNCKCSSVR